MFKKSQALIVAIISSTLPSVLRADGIRIVAALIIGIGSLGAAVSTSERDVRVEAIEQLISAGFRLPAQRAIEDFTKGSFGDELFNDALAYAFADAFRGIVADKVEAKRLEDVYQRLKPKLEPRIKANNLPPPLANMLSADSTTAIVRLVNDVLRTMNPNLPEPRIELADEKVAALDRSIKTLIGLAGKEFAAALDRIKAHGATEEKASNLPDAMAQTIEQEAVLMRRDAVRVLYLAHIALREVCTRGDKFKIDPTPANDFFRSILSKYKNEFEAWEFEWAWMHPELQAWMNVLYCEGVRQRLDGYKADDGLSGAMAVIDLSLSEFQDAKVKEAVLILQLKTWAHVLRWQLELNTPSSIELGLDSFRAFLERYKGNKAVALTSEGECGRVLGEIYLLAARLNTAKGDANRADALLVEVQSGKNDHAGNAKQWMIGSGAFSGDGDWGSQPICEDPGKALTIAKAYLGEAAIANASQARKYYLNAAVHLRNGVLGLNNSAFDDQFVEIAPSIFLRYSMTLSKLNLRYQAAIIAMEGLRLIERRITKKTNPWKSSNGEWTRPGLELRNLATNALIYSAYLNSMVRSNGTNQLNQDVLAIAKLIDETLIGKGQEWNAIIGQKQEKDFSGAIAAAQAYADKYKEDYYKTFALITSIRLDWIAYLNSTGDAKKASEVLDELNQSIERVERIIDAELAKKDIPALQLKVLKGAKNTCISAHADALLQQRKFSEVMDKLGPAFWEIPPTDPDLGARMLSLMTRALYENQRVLMKNAKAKAEPQVLIQSWPNYRTLSNLFKKYSPRYDNSGTPLGPSRTRLAITGQNVVQMADGFINNKMMVAEMAKISGEAKGMFAEFVVIKPDSKPELIFAVANTKWEIGDKDGAADLFEQYKKILAALPTLRAYQDDPEDTIEQYGDILARRINLKKSWDGRGGIRDLLVDKVGFMEEYRTTPSAKLSEEKRDYREAFRKLKEFRKAIEVEGALVGSEGKAKLIAQLDKLQEMVKALADMVTADSKLAQFYRESGHADKAIPIYETLYHDYDPLNEAYAAGYVEGVLEALRHGKAIESKIIEDARRVAVATINGATQRDVYWMAFIQHLELSAYLNDKEIVETRLRFAEKNKSTPRDDLFSAAPAGTDKRVKIPRNKLAVELARRFLELYRFVPSLRASFRIDSLILPDGKSFAIFTDVDAPNFEARIDSIDGEDRIVVVEAVATPAKSDK